MEVQADQIAIAAARDILPWPIPPFFRLAAPLAKEHAWACAVELLNGYTIVGDLQSFEPGQGNISLAMPDREGAHQLNLDSVRTIRLSSPLVLVRDNDVIGNVSTNASQVADERSCVVRFRDGKTLTGTTRGFIKEEVGLFLYLLEGEPSQVVRCFVPAQQLADVHIGPHLGDTLVRTKQISDKILATALKKQEKLRHEPIGQHLVNRGIVSADDLRLALQSQKYRPAAKLGELLVEAALITSAQLDQSFAELQTVTMKALDHFYVETLETH